MNNEYFLKNHQLVVSYELLQLLHWIMTKKSETIRFLVQQAREEGVLGKNGEGEDELLDMHEMHEELQHLIVHFFDLLENSIQESHLRENNSTQPLLSTLSQVDKKLCGENTIALSIAQTNNIIKRNGKESSKEAFYQELLKNWHPRNNSECA